MPIAVYFYSLLSRKINSTSTQLLIIVRSLLAQKCGIIYNKELLAIVQCFKIWRCYLKHAAYITRVLYNYNNLRYFMTIKSLSARQAQYAKELAKFNFKIEYKLGKANPANILFQHPDYTKGFKDGSKRTVLNAILPILQQKLQVIGLIGSPGATILNQ